MSPAEATVSLDLHSLHPHTWYIQGTCATDGESLYESLEWLVETLKRRHM
jgi:ADP-ribosylation factor protein 1